MRPSLNILEPELIGRIVDEAMRVLSETGMETRGAEMRRRLIDHGLPTDANGRVVFRPAPNQFGSPYTTFDFVANDGFTDSNQ